MTLVFVAFSQKESSFKSLLRDLLNLSTEFCLSKIHALSAERNGEESLIVLCKSLIYRRKRRNRSLRHPV